MKGPVNVSVLMTVYNGERTITRALDSLLAQDFGDNSRFEIVVVNDGSTDQTIQMLRRYEQRHENVRVIDLARVGRARALNIGLEACQAPYIAINDADDVSHAQRLRRQYEYMEKNPDAVLVSGWARVTGDDGKLKEERRLIDDDELLRRRLALGNPFIHSTIMYRKSELERVGGFSEARKAAIDYDAIVRLARLGRLGVLQEFVLTHYRGKEQYFRSKMNPTIRWRSAASVGVRAAAYHAKFLLPLSLLVYALTWMPFAGLLWRYLYPFYSRLLSS